MDSINIKKEQYEVVDNINTFLFKVKDKEGKEYLAYDFSDNLEGFFDFKYASKRLKAAGVTTPKVIKIDKKNHTALLEYISGSNVFDMLRIADLGEKIIEQAFIQNYKARTNRLRLDFDPINFIYQNDVLYYMPFTFNEYIRDEDFTQKELRLWFYTNEFKNLLISKGLPVDQSRLKNEYERNKEIVLTVVKYFR